MKRQTITLLTAFAAATALASTAQAAEVVPGGWTGDYRIIFTTTGTYTAVATGIATYNARVEAEAAATSGDTIDLSGITGWKMIGSTVGMNARVNTDTVGSGGANDVPIYNVNGVRVAAGNAALWGVSEGAFLNLPPLYYDVPADALLAPILNIVGDTAGSRIWTGTAPDGSTHTGNELGAPLVGQGRGLGYLDSKWISQGATGNPNLNTNTYFYHALSPVIIGPPPPLAITEIQYDPDAESGPTVTLTWHSLPGTTYKAFVSSDLSDWGFVLADMLGAAHDVIGDDGDHITVTFPLIDGLENVPDLFFRIEEEE